MATLVLTSECIVVLLMANIVKKYKSFLVGIAEDGSGRFYHLNLSTFCCVVDRV